jgi:lipoprotein-releasing system ATP-binding protein
MLSTKLITKSYGNLNILKGVTMDVKSAEIVAIVGASGAGKSTLLHILGSLEKPDSGSLLIDNTDVFSLSDSALASFRNLKIGFVFQFHHLLPEFSAMENVSMPAWIAKHNKKETLKRATELLTILKMEHRLHHKPAQLSGGEQQRIAIARALMNKPAIVLADEPTGNLDSTNSTAIFDIINELRNELKQTFIMVTHNQDLANMCDRFFTMKDGKTI